jgi:hypothetical protein
LYSRVAKKPTSKGTADDLEQVIGVEDIALDRLDDRRCRRRCRRADARTVRFFQQQFPKEMLFAPFLT